MTGNQHNIENLPIYQERLPFPREIRVGSCRVEGLEGMGRLIHARLKDVILALTVEIEMRTEKPVEFMETEDEE